MVSKTEIKVGDVIECVPECDFTFKGAHSDEPNGGSGYWEGRVFRVGRMSEGLPAGRYNVYFPMYPANKPTTGKPNTHGVYAYACRKLTREELPLSEVVSLIKDEINEI